MRNGNIAIITARGGSKRIPRKNIKDFLGKPIIFYSINAALESNIFDTVMVSTDDEEIAEISKRFGAEVPFFRSAETSNDYATTEDVIREVVLKYQQQGKMFDAICCLYPTAPFVTGEKLSKAMHTLCSSDADALIPIVKFDYPPQRSLVLKNEKLSMRYPEFTDARSQDLEEWYHDCGQFYCMKTQAFLEHQTMLTDNTISIIISGLEVQDIDNESDWKIAEMKYKLLNNRSESE